MAMQRPPFHHYPLSSQQISDIHRDKEAVERDIRDNLTEIRLLNNKMAKFYFLNVGTIMR